MSIVLCGFPLKYGFIIVQVHVNVYQDDIVSYNHLHVCYIHTFTSRHLLLSLCLPGREITDAI